MRRAILILPDKKTGRLPHVDDLQKAGFAISDAVAIRPEAKGESSDARQADDISIHGIKKPKEQSP